MTRYSVHRRKGRLVIYNLCLNCRQPFPTTRRDAKTCGIACRVAYHRAKNAEISQMCLDEIRREDQQLRLERLFA